MKVIVKKMKDRLEFFLIFLVLWLILFFMVIKLGGSSF